MAMLFGPNDKFVKITYQYAKYAPEPNPFVGIVVGAVIFLIALLIVFAKHS